MPKEDRPKWDADVVQRVGDAALELALKHRAALEPRLPAGLIDGLATDTKNLRAAGTDNVVVHSEQHSKTISRPTRPDRRPTW